jgi:hypothetical protein
VILLRWKRDARLTSTGETMMVGYAPDGKFLSESPEGKDWHIRLARVHKSQCDEFAVCNGKPLTAADIRAFLPNWGSLQWSHLRKGVGPSKAITATDGEIHVAIIIMDDCPLGEEQIIGEFRQFMADDAPE